MRQFTDVEKQLMQAMINDQQKRRQLTVRDIARRRDGKKRESPAWKYGFLGLILCLLGFNVFHLLKWQHFGLDQYGNLVVALMLLFNHIAFYFTTRGWPSRIMKAVAVIWLVLGFAYVAWLLIGN